MLSLYRLPQKCFKIIHFSSKMIIVFSTQTHSFHLRLYTDGPKNNCKNHSLLIPKSGIAITLCVYVIEIGISCAISAGMSLAVAQIKHNMGTAISLIQFSRLFLAGLISGLIVLFENNTRGPNEYFGRDEFYNPIIVRAKNNLEGKIRKIKIISGNQNTLFGEIIEQNETREFAA